MKLSKCVNKMIVECQPIVTKIMPFKKTGLLTQKEIEEISDIALGNQPTIAQATKVWDVKPQPWPEKQMSKETC